MKQTFKKSVSLLLASVMAIGVFSTMPSTAFAAGVDYNHNASTSTDEYYNLISKTDWDNAPGISESEIVLNNDAGDYRQVIHIMKADVNNSYVNVIPTYSEMNTSNYQTGTMLDQANWIDQNMDGEVIGVMNCCLSWYTGYPGDRVGEPLGFMMMNGEIMFDPGNCGYDYGNVGFPTCVVINKDVNDAGEVRPTDISKLEMVQIRTSADLDGWEDTVIPISSGYIVKDGVNQYNKAHNDPAPRSVVGITADGQVVMMENDGRQSPFSAGMNMYECAEVMIAAGCVWAANCDGGGSSTFVSQRPGEELKVTNSPSDGGLRPSTSGICFISTAPADGQFYKAHISSGNEYYTPNSKVQFDAVGTDMAGTVVEIPAEAEWQLTDASFGTVEDGIFTSNGKEGEVTVQLVYNDEVVGEASITIVLPEIAFRNETIVIGYGDTMVLPVEVTTNKGRNPVAYDEDDIFYILSNNGLGTVVGDKFTACDASSGLIDGTITAVICGQEDKSVTANIRFGKASEIVYDFEDGELPLDTSNTGNIGGDDAADTGEYIYGWHVSDTRLNRHYSYRWINTTNYTPIGLDIPSRIYVVNNETGLVRNGDYAMGLDIDWTNVTASCHGQIEVFLPESLDLTDATSVGFWLYIPAEMVTASMDVSATFRTTTGSTRVDYKLKDHFGTQTSLDNGGWYYFSWEVLDNYKSFEYITINSHYTATAGVDFNYYQDVTYYIDDITVDYSDATIDRENPYFTSMTIADEYTNGVEVSGQTITANTITLMAQANENTSKANATGLDRNSVKLYVDGVLSNADISMANNGTITVSDLYLNDGVHTLVMEISDIQGNVGNIVRKVTVNTDKSDVRLEVPASTGLLPTGSIYWINLVADNLATVNSVTVTVNLDYVNSWELEGMEVAYGFKAEYYINNHNDAVITFTRTGTEIADTTILAKLPVRIWMAKGWMDDSGIRKDYISNDPAKQDKYYILTPHAMWYSDGTRDYRLAVSAEAGVVTYVDGTTMTFSANETVIQTEMNRYYTNADRQGKWSFHICTPGIAQSKAPTCTESGYENRVFCVGCSCGSVENLGTECDTHNGCGSVIDWGTTVPALGHEYAVNADGKLACVNGGELFNGVYTDGKTYVDGVAIADGWNEEGTAYYVDGIKLTGAHIIDKVVYTFDENGIYQPDVVYNGFISDNGVTMYFYTNTNYEKEYLYVNDAAYYFVDGIAKDGEYTINGETCLFKDGKYISCLTADIMDAGWESMTVTYIIYSDGSMILGGEGETYKYTSRAQLPWYKFRTKISSIFIGKEITSLGHYALADIYYTKSIVFEEGSELNYIGAGTFLSCYGITEIVLPDSVQTIVQNSFKMCKNLEDVYLPAGIKYLNKLTFVNNQNEVMPNIKLHVYEDTYAEDYAKQYNIPYEYRVFVDTVVASGFCGINATWELYKSGKIVISGSGAMDNYTDKESTPWAEYLKQIKSVEIGKDITVIGNYAFAYATNVTSITFEEDSKLEKIGAAGFLYTYATEVTIPETVTVIGNLSFAYCSRLEDVVVPQNVTLIYPESFKKSSNVILNVASGTYAENYAKTNGIEYESRAFVDMIVANGTCGENAIWTLYASGKIVISGSGAMDNYTDKESTPWAEYLKQIKSVEIGKDITVIGNYAFAYATNVTSITFEEDSKLEKIGAAGFLYTYATEVTIPETVTVIGNLSFAYCSRLEDVVVPQNVTLIYPESFKKSSNVILNVASGTYAENYAKTNGIEYESRAFVDMIVANGTCGENAIWTLYASGKIVISGSGAMDNYTDKESTPWAEYLKQIKSVEIGKDITVIGNYAFAYATNVTSITFEEDSKLEKIGAVGFLYTYATEVTIPETVTVIGNLSFAYCSRLEDVVVPQNVTLIYPESFKKSSIVILNVASGTYAENYAKTNGIAYESR